MVGYASSVTPLRIYITHTRKEGLFVWGRLEEEVVVGLWTCVKVDCT